MASSLIRINEATAPELEQLPTIGPKRARRIIRYREQVAPLAGYRDLAAAAGISHSMAQRAAPLIDWSNGKRPILANLLFSLGAAVACIFLYYYALQGAALAGAGPAGDFYGLTVGLILIGSLAALLLQLLRSYGLDRPGPGWVTLVTCATGLFLLTALLVFTLIGGTDDDFDTYVYETCKLLLYIGIIAVLLYGPAWHVRSTFRQFDFAAIAFDYGQFGLGLFALALLLLADPPELVDELFGIWTGVTLILNAREMIYGRSSYVSTLSEREQARLAFLVEEEASTRGISRPSRLMRAAGWLLALVALGLILVTARLLIAFD